MKKNLLLLAMLFGAMFTFTACGGDDDDDNGGGGGTTYEDTRITNVIPDKYIQQLAKHMSIYDGVTPPTVEGRFVMAPTKLVYDSKGWDGSDVNWADNYFEFYNQSSSNKTVSVKQTTDSGNYSGTGTGAYICGKDNNFTIYFNETGVSYGINFKQAVIISGVKTSSGIRNLTKAFIMLERGEKTGDNDIMKVGEYRIFTDGDGMSDPVESSAAKGAAVTGQFFPMNIK